MQVNFIKSQCNKFRMKYCSVLLCDYTVPLFTLNECNMLLVPSNPIKLVPTTTCGQQHHMMTDINPPRAKVTCKHQSLLIS